MSTDKPTLLSGSRVYLSGPMDFIGSRVIEKYLGWRSILTPILQALNIFVMDPWNKPPIQGLDHEYGKEGVHRDKAKFEKDFWTNPETRALYDTEFWETVHIDLRMTDISDFMIAFTPTNIYSVGTVHEIIVAKGQKKPVLLVSPPISYEFFPEIAQQPQEVKDKLKYYGLKENPIGLPSQWYSRIVGGHYLFDGFGWEGISLKSDNFYPELFNAVLEEARNNPETDLNQWFKVKEWLDGFKPLQDLKGGVLDHVEFSDEEEKNMFEKEFNENKDHYNYFWYNQPYTPRRPALYQILSIASGYIPPKVQLNSQLDVNGKLVHHSVKIPDDNWILVSLTDDQNYL
ncbi:MAG: hypothetical protein INQ03_00565 [Candidatus Heimdallarchaeota archaeon]|nr:hypothetical protein [Candidatus Heimdallarchaeota archaeon]